MSSTKVNSIFKGYVSPVFGDYVWSERKDKQLTDVLKMKHPERKNFYFLVRTLKEFKMPFDYVMEIVEKHNSWENYDRQEFKTELDKIYKAGSPNSTNAGAQAFTTHSPAFLNPGDIVSYFKTLPVYSVLSVPSDIDKAVVAYQFAGLSVVPRHGDYETCGNNKCVESKFCKHPHLSINWKQEGYHEKSPSWSKIIEWEKAGMWAAGLCLIARDDIVFLDVDPEGMKYIDDSLFNGRQWEKTRRGYHFFAKGVPGIKSAKMGGIELKAKGSLIVAAPTQGYIAGKDWAR